MWGFIALEDDLNTVVGFGFYDQEETPGLGGEVENPRWKAQFPGKLVYGEDGNVQLELKKGGIDPNNEMGRHLPRRRAQRCNADQPGRDQPDPVLDG